MQLVWLTEYEFFIGKKGALTYVGAILAKINPDKDTFIIKARGKINYKAVDIALITVSKFKNLEIKDVFISTEKVFNRNKQEILLSCIEISIG